MRENMFTARVRNAQLTHGLQSRAARRVVGRVRAGLAHRGLSMAQRERILHDTLLMLGECEEAGVDPVEALLGSANVEGLGRRIEGYCDEVAAECPRTPTVLAVVRFAAQLVLAFAVVFAVHLAYRIGANHSWLPWPALPLRTTDAYLVDLELLLIPLLLVVAQVISSVIRVNPWPHLLPSVLTPVLFGIALLVIDNKTAFFWKRHAFWGYDYNTGGLPSVGSLFGGLALGVEDMPWVTANRLVLIAGIAVIALADIAAILLIERCDPQRR